MAKKIVGYDIGSYTFDALAQTVTFIGITGLIHERILLITNLLTEDIIYSPQIKGRGGTFITNVLTLEYDTTAMSNTDILQIFIYEDYDKFRIADIDNHEVSISSNGELYTINQPPSLPEGRTLFKIEAFSLVDGGLTIYTTSIIPNGETLILQTFLVAGEDTLNKAHKVFLYYAPNGIIDGTEEIIIPTYLPGSDTIYNIANTETYLGNGTAAIIIERTRLDSQARNIYAKVVGYY